MQAVQIREFPNATYTGPPFAAQVGDEQVFAFMSRPLGGGPICIVHLLAGDGRAFVSPIDMREFMYSDCFGAMPFVSRFTGTLKVAVNVKLGDRDDRGLVIVDTGRAV